MREVSKTQDHRIYTSIEQLSELQYQADPLLLKPNSKASSLRAGHYLSHYRGRGLSFEEYRQYQAGDDVRDIDWRVTMRTRNPMIKVFNDEKDLPVIIIVDQRLSMLFSTVDTMKSVVAAEIAALCAWQVFKAGDRVGAVLFNDQRVDWIPPKRSKQHLSQLLNKLVQFNQQLTYEHSEDESISSPIKAALDNAARSKIKGGLYIVLSDFQGFDDGCKQALRNLQQYSDVLGVQVYDPLERSLEGASPSYLSDGDQQLQTPNSNSKLAKKYASVVKLRTDKIKTGFGIRSLPFIELTTDGKHVNQFQQTLSLRVR